MAAKRVKTTTVKEELPETEPELVDLSGDASAINAILQRFPDDSFYVEVYKDEAGTPEYCETIRSKNINKDEIRDNWGGGKFELRIYNNGELDSTIVFKIANRKIPAPGATVNPNENILRDQNRFFERMIMAMLLKQDNNKGGGGNGVDVKDMFGMWLEMNKTNNPERTLEVLTRGMELGAKSSGPASSDWKAELINATKDIFKTVAPTFLEIAAARQAQTVPGANGATTMPTQIAPTTDVLIKQGIVELKSYVMKGLPVALALDWIIANGEKYQHVIKAVLTQGPEKLEALDAELASEPYKSWMKTLFEGLADVYSNNSNNANEDTNGDGGDGGDVASNGGVS